MSLGQLQQDTNYQQVVTCHLRMVLIVYLLLKAVHTFVKYPIVGDLTTEIWQRSLELKQQQQQQKQTNKQTKQQNKKGTHRMATLYLIIKPI